MSGFWQKPKNLIPVKQLMLIIIILTVCYKVYNHYQTLVSDRINPTDNNPRVLNIKYHYLIFNTRGLLSVGFIRSLTKV
jgi:hypothetical protein